MNWKKLPKQKRDHLVAVAMLTVAALGGLGWGLIRTQYVNLQLAASETEDAGRKLERMKTSIKQAEEIETQLATHRQSLAVLENEMGSGDLYSWGLDFLRRFRESYKVEVPAIGQPVVGDTTLLPKFPYKQAAFTVGGTAFYHDLGRFIADFENQFPHFRIVNLNLDPASALKNTDQEKLEFKMDIVALVRPTPN